MTVAIGWFLSPWLMAYPFLQLDIGGGLYDAVDESVYSQSKVFTLYALENTASPAYREALLDPKFYVSMALVPSAGASQTVPDYGSIKIDGKQFLPGSPNWTYGTPPLDGQYPPLGPHAIFPAYCMQLNFNFDAGQRAAAYNVQDNPGGLQTAMAGSFFYHAFNIDVSNLKSDYELHFDLYRTSYDEVLQKRKIKTYTFDTDFAPYSHDAYYKSESYGSDIPLHSEVAVPDGSATIVLLGITFCGVVGMRKRLSAVDR